MNLLSLCGVLTHLLKITLKCAQTGFAENTDDRSGVKPRVHFLTVIQTLLIGPCLTRFVSWAIGHHSGTFLPTYSSLLCSLLVFGVTHTHCSHHPIIFHVSPFFPPAPFFLQNVS